MMDTRLEQALLVASLGLAACAVVCWLLFGKDEKRAVRKLSMPPPGLNPVELGYVLDGDVSYADIVPLLIHWAEQGNVRFDCSSGDPVLVKAERLEPGARAYETYLFKELFIGRDALEPYELAKCFRPVMNRVRRMVPRYFEVERSIFTGVSLALRRAFMILTAVPMLSVLILSLYRGMGQIASAVIATGIAGTVLLIPIIGMVKLLHRWRGERRVDRTHSLIRLLFAIALFMTGYFFFAKYAQLPALAPVAAASTLICGVCTAFMEKRTEDGLDLQYAAEGLKKFILDVEDEELRRLQQEDLRYFYKMLPYAWVLGESSRWAADFDGIPVDRPHWLVGYTVSDGEFSPVDVVRSLRQPMQDFLFQMIVASGRVSADRTG